MQHPSARRLALEPRAGRNSFMSSPFRDGLLRDKHALLTGGGSGINLRIAERFAAQGAKVSLIGRTREKLDAACRLIEGQGGSAEGYAADVREYDVLARAIQSASERYGKLDVVVCGAAGNFPAPAAGMSANGFKAVVDIDLLGTFNTLRAAFEHMRRPGASVINISATQAFAPMSYQAHVCAAKAGVDMLTRTLALEWGSQGVRVNSIAPGAVDETEGMNRLAPTAAARKTLIEGIPLRRFAAKDEIADLALFLCSDAAQYMTGAVVVCDGGQSLANFATIAMSSGIPPGGSVNTRDRK